MDAVSTAPGLVFAEGRAVDVVAFEAAVVAFFVEAADMLGVPKSVAAIYGICFANAEPLSFSDIQERLNISAGSISQGLRVLREIGALKLSTDTSMPPLVGFPQLSAVRSTRPRERYTPDLELRKLVAHYLEERVQKHLDSGRGRLRAIGQALPVGRDVSAKELKERLEALQTWHDKSRAAMPVIKAFLKLT